MSLHETSAPPNWDPARHPLDSDEEEGGWLPTGRQLLDVLVLRMERAIGPDPAGVPFHRGLHTSMRQGLGLIVLIGLLIGLPALVVGLFTGLPFTEYLPFRWLTSFPRFGFWVDRASALSGISLHALSPLATADYQALPRSTTTLLAIGTWLTLPVRLMTLWLVGGLPVMVVARMLGSHCTLPRFYSATAFAFLPFVLLLLAPFPAIGAAVTIVALLWFALVYALAVHVAMGTDWGHTLVVLLAVVFAIAILGAAFAGILLLLA